MTSTLLEQARVLNEDIDQFENACATLMLQDARTHRENLVLSTRVNEFVEKMVNRHERLAVIYGDADHRRKQELQEMEGDPSGTQLYTQFYNQLQEIKEYHRKFPNLDAEEHEAKFMLNEEASQLALTKILSNFNTEESCGRYMDLHDIHFTFSNLQGIRTSSYAVDYMQYLHLLSDQGFVNIPNETRRSSDYLPYLHSLSDYLTHFLQRTQPLFDFEGRLQETYDRFNRTWQDQTFQILVGTTTPPSTDKKITPPPSSHAMVDQKTTQIRDWLLPWQLSSELAHSLDLYCPCCLKTMSKQSVWISHLRSPKHQRAHDKLVKLTKDTSLVEAIIFEFSELLQDIFVSTRENIQKKQARIPGEGSTYLDDQEDDWSKEDLEQDPHQIRLTKKNYPVGPDGNPLPYWLYKLQGLSHEFVCQICGNTSYFGRRAYERHFSDYRHTHGLKCLGLENNKDMFEITRIKDALELGKRLKVLKSQGKWHADTMEEFEDADGTILDKQTYELLAKQFG